MLLQQNLASWTKNGYLKLDQYYDQNQMVQIKNWTNELASLPEIQRKWMLYYENNETSNEKTLCRIENFIDYHDGFMNLLSDKELLSLIATLLEEEPVIFKEKINFKLPGGGGFAAHQDAPAYSMFNQRFHLTCMICIDDANVENGCMQFASGRHQEGLFAQEPNGDMKDELVKSMKWEYLTCKSGDIVFFDSYIPHRSDPNKSSYSRNALFATFNKVSERSLRATYYEAKRKYFPPDYERDPNQIYDSGGPFNLGNPIK